MPMGRFGNRPRLNIGLFRIGMTVQSLFFTRCPWGDTKSAHARDPPLDGLYIRCVRVLDTGPTMA